MNFQSSFFKPTWIRSPVSAQRNQNLNIDNFVRTGQLHLLRKVVGSNRKLVVRLLCLLLSVYRYPGGYNFLAIMVSENECNLNNFLSSIVNWLLCFIICP